MALAMLVAVYAQAIFYGFCVVFKLFCGYLKYGRKLFAKNVDRQEPRCLTDRAMGDHKFMLIHGDSQGGKGLKIHYVIKGDPQKPLLLLVHGFPEIWYSWRHQITELSKDYCVVAIDQRGYGKSDKPVGIENYSLDHLTSDICAIIDGLGRQSAILVGHDWGGVVCWATAALYPERVEKLVILNCPHSSAFQKCLRSSLKQIRLSWYINFFQLPYLPELYLSARDFAFISAAIVTSNKRMINADDTEAVKYYLQEPNGVTAPVNFYRALFRHPPRMPKTRLRMPVLIIWGTKDLALSTELASMSCAYCEDVTLKLLDGISHWVQRDDPVRVNNLIRHFVSQ